MTRKLLAWVGGISLLLLAQTASAQHYQYRLPVEKGILETQLNLQYQYSKYTDYNHSILAIEGQYAFGMLEVGLNVPLLAHSFLGASGTATQLGDIILQSKLKLFAVGKNLGAALFFNAQLPTHSGDGGREYAGLRFGAAATAQLLGFTVGGNAHVLWDIIGNGQDDVAYLGLTAYARAPIFPLLALQLALEFYNSVKPSGDSNILAATPGIELSLLGLFASVSARVAVTDEARAFFGGRVAGLLAVGYRY